MPTCSSCGGSNDPGIIYCQYCDAHLGRSYESKYSSKFATSDEEIAVLEKEKLAEIQKISRSLKNGQFNMLQLDKLANLEEELLEINSDLLLFRFSELINDISDEYLNKNSICLFGSNKDLFKRYL
tara:strand:- start:209 stop:586 length:378 start_codon:yes stop_codon:yes gene_type:complete